MRFFLIISTLSLLLCSCFHKDEKLVMQGELDFSEDTVFFDTLFTSLGSVTHRVKVYNPNPHAVKISSIELGGLASSPYDLIIDGVESNAVQNLHLRGGDSMYVLVKVTIDPQNMNTPYLVTDSILFHTNGNLQKVQLVAYGQDANFLTSKTLGCDTTWTSGKPFVVYNYARVPAGCSLTIQKGVKVYFHENAILDVKGTLLVYGNKDSLVVFSGDKLSGFYSDVAGQWQGIVMDAGSKNNLMQYAEIRNAVHGISVAYDPSDADTIAEIRLENCSVKNMQGYGLVSYGMDTYAENSLFTNAVKSVVAGLGGGDHHFVHCTFSNYSYDFFREGSAVNFSNSYSDLSVTANGDLKTRFTNCILWGDKLEELDLDNNGTFGFDFLSFSSILKTQRTDQTGNLINTDPLFVKAVDLDFHLKAESPAIDSGLSTGLTIDLEGVARDASPDRGCYEFIP